MHFATGVAPHLLKSRSDDPHLAVITMVAQRKGDSDHGVTAGDRRRRLAVCKDCRFQATEKRRTRDLGDGAASLAYGGPSVTWEFQFAKQPDGTWLVTAHED